jgi:Restriction endonuclease BsobI
VTKPYLQHLKNSEDLVTKYEATRAGFVSLALERNRRATPFVAQARALKCIALTVKKPAQLLEIENISSSLLTASGISDKATAHLQEQDKISSIKGLIENFLEPAGKNFVEELVYRFLLTRGDTLGGAMRNAGGAIAHRKLIRTLISNLQITGKEFNWLNERKKWTKSAKGDENIEFSLRGLSWKNKEESRTIIFNLTVPTVEKNIDLCLLNCSSSDIQKDKQAKEFYKDPNNYLAFGELKGGIDPAGADEHWKTARTALDRIRTSFSKLNLQPKLFFIGAAIEKQMSDEIWDMLENTLLANAANLTDDTQFNSIARWLCSI